MNQAFHLYRLQQIDSQIDQINSVVNELNKYLSNDEAILQANQSVDVSAKHLHQEQQKLKQLEFAVKEQQIKINLCESTLYSGKVRNPKELQDLQKEIISLKKHLSALEDQQLEAMMLVEQSESDEQHFRSLLTQAQTSFAEKSAGWLGKKENLTRNLERLSAERATILPAIDQSSMQVYDSIRKRKNGVAVTTASEGSCSVCGTNIRPMELQSARSAQDLVYCSSCGRILYVG